jgi:hypothetical protein
VEEAGKLSSYNLQDEAPRRDKRYISARKSEANRRNALRSTGPRTTRGKAKSRGNALKHGFFARDLFTRFAVQRENPQEFQDFIAELRAIWQPVGCLEELEIDRIAICWWTRLRLWRYEYAEVRAAQGEVGVRGVVSNSRELMHPDEKALILLLENAEKEIQSNGKFSPELKEKLLASSDPWFREVWLELEQRAREVTKRFTVFQTGRTPRGAIFQAALAIGSIEKWAEQQESVMNRAYDEQLVPNSEALDKILRYGTAVARKLNRTYERLGCLQCKRRLL